MWRTQLGNRVLAGPEAALFQEGLADLVWSIEDDVDNLYDAGVSVFDNLSKPEKLAILEYVARALLVKRVKCPRHTAVNEGAIAAVYTNLRCCIESEIEMGKGDFRAKVLAACKFMGKDYNLPRPRSKDFEQWCDQIEWLMDRIFWDRDWEGGFIELDDSPDKANTIRKLMGVDAEYYVAVPPDPSPAQLKKIKSSLRRLWRRPPGLVGVEKKPVKTKK